MTLLVYVVMVFLTPVHEELFGSLVSAAEFATMDECLAAMPEVLADEFAELGPSIEGAACVTQEMANSIRAAQDITTP